MPSPSAAVLEVRHLAKRYGERVAVHDVSLQVHAGQLVGLLGPNGAGKSTTIAMVCGLTTADQGEVSVAGQRLADAPDACRRQIGLVTQDLALVEELSAWRNVAFFGALYGLRGAALRARCDEVLALVGLADRAADKPGTFSGGMKRRLHIACALVHDPALLLLDEPTAGVDPQSRNAIFETLENLKRRGKALVYTTHYMEEVERLADTIVIVDHGRVVAEGTLADLVRRLPATRQLVLDFEHEPDAQTLEALRALPAVRALSLHQGSWHVAIDELTGDAAQVLTWLSGRGLALRQLASGRTGLEDVFLSLTGRALRS